MYFVMFLQKTELLRLLKSHCDKMRKSHQVLGELNNCIRINLVSGGLDMSI